jgi:hypothetical protein
MLVYAPFCFVFCYTLWRFYAFSGTNLLTRCHSISSLFLCFRKVTQEIFSELDETKAEVPIFSDTRRSPKQRWRGARGGPEGGHTPHGAGHPWLRRGMVWAPGPPSDIALPPIYSPRRENPKHPINFPENILQAAAIVDARSGGSRSSFGTLPERGITTGGLLHHHACLRSDL